MSTTSPPPGPDSQDPDRALIEKIMATDKQLEELQDELARRRRAREEEGRAPDEDDERYEALWTYLEQAQVNWREVAAFFRSAVTEQKEGRPWGEEPRSVRAGSADSTHGTDATVSVDDPDHRTR
ncbi:MAG: hypothetical protein Q4G40_11760 [Brachybacterium sp.]|nr:hypothetical protein [Brachybacterium sp.]